MADEQVLAGRISLSLGEQACDVTELFRSIGFLSRAVHLLERDFIRCLPESALPFGTYSALLVIQANPGIRQRQVANILVVQESNMAALVKRMLRDGLIQRPNDQRSGSKGLQLTAQGEQLLSRMMPVMQGIDSGFAQGLSQQEHATLLALLAKLVLSRLNPPE